MKHDTTNKIAWAARNTRLSMYNLAKGSRADAMAKHLSNNTDVYSSSETAISIQQNYRNHQRAQWNTSAII